MAEGSSLCWTELRVTWEGREELPLRFPKVTFADITWKRGISEQRIKRRKRGKVEWITERTKGRQLEVWRSKMITNTYRT